MTTVLATRGLTKRYGARLAVEDLNLTVEEGDLYGFLGVNGAGKTTTIRMVLGLIRPTAGSVELFGRELRSNFLEIMAKVGALVERPAFYPNLSGLANVELMGRLSGGVTRAAALEILEAVGLADQARDRAHTYSLGMSQRLGVALALAARPKLAILDEPTNGLDPGGISRIRELLLERNRTDGTTFLISSHLLYEVEQTCTRVAILKSGRLVLQDRIDAVLARAAAGVRLRASDGATAVVARLPYVRKVEPDGDALRVSLEAADAGRLNADLVAAGVQVMELTPLRPSLEEFFLSLQEAA